MIYIQVPFTCHGLIIYRMQSLNGANGQVVSFSDIINTKNSFTLKTTCHDKV